MTDITKIKKLKDRVEYILMEYPDTRNNDRLLTWTYWEVFDSDLWRSAWGRKDRHSIGKKEYIKGHLAMPESIKRARAYVQNTQGKYLPTDPKVAKTRKIDEVAWSRAMGSRTYMQSHL